ncbi:hypothetical protein KXY27_004539 [Salmonella enterica]|nr:hypothetical protein [Salmonella enterica]EHU5767737.1 hypothetical protein [Salmonella enterica]
MTTEINVITADNKQVQAKIAHVTTLVSKSVSELGALFIDLCERFTAKDNHSGDNLQHLLNGLEGSKGAKRYQSAIIARLNDFSDKTLSIDYDEEKKSYIVATKKGDDKKSLFKKEKFIEAVNAAKAAEFALNAPKATETAEEKAARLEEARRKKFFKKVKEGDAEKEISKTLVEFAKAKLETDKDATPEKLRIALKSLIDQVLLDVKAPIEGETE